MVGKFILQWHLSENCNLKCKHCYQKDHKPTQLSKKDLLDILNQYRQFLEKTKRKGHINLTGGEPLCCPYLFDLLEEFKNDEENYSFSILTNGTLITKEVAKRIKNYNPEYVQVSLEGGKKTNDEIRGKGVYQKVGKALDYLKQEKIFTSISFTATKINYKEFPKVVKFAEKHKVDVVWSDRYIPTGKEIDQEFIMGKEETKEYLEIMAKERRRLQEKKSNTHVSMNRALQFQMTNNLPYHCSAGEDLLTVMENGDLVPCRRMPIVVGNLQKEDMHDLYTTNPILKKLQNKSIPEECHNCEYERKCRGGLKCLTYALYKNLNKKDIGCMLEESI